MKAIHFLVIRFGLYFFFAAVTSPILFFSAFLIRYASAHEQLEALRYVFILIALGWIYGFHWLASRTAQQMAFEDRTFGAAVKCTLNDLRFNLVLLPMIGHWFAPKSRKDDDKDEDDDA